MPGGAEVPHALRVRHADLRHPHAVRQQQRRGWDAADKCCGGLATCLACNVSYADRARDGAEDPRRKAPTWSRCVCTRQPRLDLQRDKVKEDGVNISSWLQALARFTGAACRRFPDLDVGAVCQFLANALRAGDPFDLLVLQQIIVCMTVGYGGTCVIPW